MNTTKYFRPKLHAYSDGANLDLRARISQSLIAAALTTDVLTKIHEDSKQMSPRALASHCCDVADALVDAFSDRGWIEETLAQDEQIKAVVDESMMHRRRQAAIDGGLT